MATSSEILINKKIELIKQIESNFGVVSKKDTAKKTGMSKRLMDYHLYHTNHHVSNIDSLEKIVTAQIELSKEKIDRVNELIGTAKEI